MNILEEYAIIAREQILRNNAVIAGVEIARAEKFEAWAAAITSKSVLALEAKVSYLELALKCRAEANRILSPSNT